ncbi:MAG: aminotransferase class I/II-fold pyridoxal phosphate-dependent enzyme [Verrucomicrobiia bacterium]
MSNLSDQLRGDLDQLRADGLYRALRNIASAQGPRIVIEGREFLNFSSNDYLGLANDLILKQAAAAAIEKYGVGAGASRLVCGNLEPYAILEERLARFKQREAAIVFGSGYAANVGTITALVGEGDVVILDKLDHASIIDGARQSGATIRVYPHKDMRKLEHLLQWATHRGGDAAPTTAGAPKGDARAASPPRPARSPRILIVTETVFSMDGDLAPLAEIVALKERYGAWLMIDEAHATGLYAKNRRGIAEAAGVEDEIDITLGTLSKALGCAGGFVVGSQTLIDYLRNRARSLIYSTALPPAVVAAAAAAADFVVGDEGQHRCDQLWRNVSDLKNGLSALGIQNESRSPIIPIIVGEENAAVEFSRKLFERGIFVPAIRFPTVPRGKARLRATVTAAHTEEQIQEFVKAFDSLRNPSGRIVVVGAASPPRPAHSVDLRKGRVSIPEHCYFITACAEGRRPAFSGFAAATILVDALRWLRDQGRIRLLGFVIMPDHIHVAFALRYAGSRRGRRSHGIGVPVSGSCWTLAKVMHALKSFTAHKLRQQLGVPIPIWQDGYHDHLLCDRRDFEQRLAYMHDNPVRKGLVKSAEEYPFSTAHPDYQNEIDRAWLEGIEESRDRNVAPTETA